jgi:hypothetical protein
MRGDYKGLKLLFQIPTFFLLAITAHVLAGGSVIATPRLLMQILAIIFASTILRKFSLEGPSLAFLIAAIQSTSHFIIGGNTYTNQATMTFGHLLSGLVSYQLISHFHEAWERIAETLQRIFLPTVIVHWLPSSRSISSAFEGEQVFLIKFFRASLRYRGPPMRLEFNNAA